MVKFHPCTELNFIDQQYADSFITLETYVAVVRSSVALAHSGDFTEMAAAHLVPGLMQRLIDVAPVPKDFNHAELQEFLVGRMGATFKKRLAIDTPLLLQHMALSHSYALFDALLADVLTVAFNHVPEQLQTKGRTLTHEEALRFPTKEDLVASLAERRVLELMHGKIEDLLKYLERSFKVSFLPSDMALGGLVHIRDLRNVIVHRNGRASEHYAATWGGQVGELVALDPDQGFKLRDDLGKICKNLIQQFIIFFKCSERSWSL